jgi:hypothetical protein
MVSLAPFGIYPLAPERCAELTCGYATFRSYLGLGRLTRALQTAGFQISSELKNESETIDMSSLVVRVGRLTTFGYRRVNIPASGLIQVLFELVEPERYAEALREMFDWSIQRFPAPPRSGVASARLGNSTFQFSNEKAVWFKRSRG